MTPLALIRALEWLSLTLAVSGVCVTAYAAWDAFMDLAEAPSGSRRSIHLYVALIGICSAISSMIGHLIFLSLGVLALTSTPRPSRYDFSIYYSGAVVFLQVVMVSASVLVLVLRRRLREIDD